MTEIRFLYSVCSIFVFFPFIIMTGEHYTERLYEVNIHLSDFKDHFEFEIM